MTKPTRIFLSAVSLLLSVSPAAAVQFPVMPIDAAELLTAVRLSPSLELVLTSPSEGPLPGTQQVVPYSQKTGAVLSGIADTVNLDVTDRELGPMPTNEEFSLAVQSAPFNVFHTFAVVTPGPGPFDPPTVEFQTRNFGALSFTAEADYRITYTTFPQADLAINPTTVRTENFQVAQATLEILSVHLVAFVDGIEVASAERSPGSDFLKIRSLTGFYQCGGLIPNQVCNFKPQDGLAISLSAGASLRFQDIFGEPVPTDGTTNGRSSYGASAAFVPEPGPGLLIGAGLIMVGLRRARVRTRR